MRVPPIFGKVDVGPQDRAAVNEMQQALSEIRAEKPNKREIAALKEQVIRLTDGQRILVRKQALHDMEVISLTKLNEALAAQIAYLEQKAAMSAEQEHAGKILAMQEAHERVLRSIEANHQASDAFAQRWMKGG